MLFPVALLAGLAAVVRDPTLRASAQRGAPALLLAEEAAKQVDPKDRLFFGALLFGGFPISLWNGVACWIGISCGSGVWKEWGCVLD